MKIRQLRFWLCLVSALLGCLWISLARLLAPDLSAQAGLIVCLGFGLLSWVTTSPTFFKKYVREATPESLGAIRIIVCTILLIMTLWIEDVPSSALLPAQMRHSMGIMQFFYSLPGFESFVRSQTSLQIFEWLTALILFLGIIGWQTRIVIPLGAFCYLLLGGIIRHYTWFFHTGLIPTYVILALSLTPCGDGLSVDRYRKIAQGKNVPIADRPSPVYGWSRYICWVVIALPYVAAGMSKLRIGGFFWWSATNMRTILYSGTLNPMQFDWGLSVQLSHFPDILFALLGIAGVYGELAFGMVLFSSIARRILPVLMMMMHIGILFLQNILFFDLILLQLVFFDFTEIKKTIARWIASNQGSVERNSHQYALKPLEASQSTAASVNNTLQSFYYPLIVSGLTITLLFFWLSRTEFYPVTSMQMFARRNNSGMVRYFKVLAHNQSGVTVRAYPEKIIPALYDTRYRRVLKACFSKEPKTVNICNKLLNTIGSVHNKKASVSEKIEQFEIQLWDWNFRANPTDPKYGDLVNRHIHKIQ